MGKRIVRQWNEENTELLAQSELFVQKEKGNNEYFVVWLQEPEVEACPWCSGKAIKMQDLFSKTYLDLIHENGRSYVITLEYGFHKFRCLNSECRHIFAKEIHFASKYDNVTYRLENEIARLVMSGLSYGKISDQLQDSITRQAIGQIFNRWVRKKDDHCKIQNPPSCIAIISGTTDKDRYTLILNLDNSICVYDALYGVQSSDIAASIRRIGITNIQTVISDCDPTIIETIKDYLPGATHIIPVHYWFKLVSDDFSIFSHDRIKWCTVRDKDNLIMEPVAGLGLHTSNLERLFRERPAVKVPHKNFNDLRTLINRRDEMWVFEELVEWIAELDPDFKDYLSLTIDRLYLHQNEIEAHVHYRDLIPEQLFKLTEEIEYHISNMRTFSAEVLRARLLYSTEADLQNWNGVPITNVLTTLNTLNGGDNK